MLPRTTRSGSTSSVKSDSPNVSTGVNKAIMNELSAISKRIDQLEKNIVSQIEIKIASMVTEISEKIVNINRRIDANEKEIAELGTKLASESRARVGELGKVEERLSKIIQIKPKNDDSGARISRLEKMVHMCDLVVRGIPANCLDLNKAFNDICRTININLDYSCTSSIFRLPTGSVIFKFLANSAKRNFFLQYLKHKRLDISHIGFDGNWRIYINESLSNETAGLLKIAIKMRNDGLLFRAFTLGGQLYIKKSSESIPIKISCRTGLSSYRGPDRPPDSCFGEPNENQENNRINETL